MVKILLESGADMKIKNKQGLTPIALAAKLARHHVIFNRFDSI